MLRVWRWDGKEIFINADLIGTVELSADDTQTNVIMINGGTLSLSKASYDVITGVITKKTGPGKAGFDVL